MMRLILALSLIGLCGCDATSAQPGDPSSVVPSNSEPINERRERHLESLDRNKKPLLELDDIEFASPALKEAVRRFTAAADGMAKPEWYRSGYREISPGGEHSGLTRYEAIWCTEATPQGFPIRDANRAIMIDRLFNSITISLDGGYPDYKTIRSVNLMADRLDKAGTGWVTRLHFRGNIRNGKQFLGHYLTTRFDHESFQYQWKRGDPYCDELDEKHSLNLGYNTISTTSMLGDVSFDTKLRVAHGLARRHDQMDEDIENIHDYAIGLLMSEESFRETALAELDELETQCRTKVPTGQMIVETMEHWEYADDGIPPFSRGEAKMLSEFPEAERQAVYRVMMAEIERRKTLVKEHSHDLYEGVTKAFPLLECLEAINSETAESE